MLLLTAATSALTGCPQLMSDDFNVVSAVGGSAQTDVSTNAGATDASGGATSTTPFNWRGLDNVSGASNGASMAGAANPGWGNTENGGAAGASSDRGFAAGGYSRRG